VDHPGSGLVRVTREFGAPALQVFDAWLSPDWLARWMFGPQIRDERIVRLDVDARVGGRFSFVVERQGEQVDHAGEYLEIDRPRRLAFTWGIGPAAESRVAIELAPAEGGSRLVLTHTLHPQWADRAGDIEQAWGRMLDALARALRNVPA
jgi:uncharacterized protein YndB with AHSA1/START domain